MSHENPMVSIIVPVYNAEKYLERCVDSILNQEYRDFELILMDDGSKDGSGEICDRYAAADDRVLVVHKENTGVSDTRNQALSLARGKYLQFSDSDDWISADATKLLVRTAQENNCDMVIADFYRVVGERVSRKGDIEEDGVMSREEFAAHMMENPSDFYYGVLWNKLYKREIVEAHQLRMDAQISWCEDFMFNLEYIRYAESFVSLQSPVYYYVKTKGSLVSQSISISKTIKMKLMVFEIYNNFYKNVLDEKEYEKNRLQVYRFLVDSAGDGLVLPSFFPGTHKLGEERVRVFTEAIAGEGVLTDLYRERKLLDYYLESAALKNAITLPEARLLFALKQAGAELTRKELTDFVDMSRGSLAMTMQKLIGRGFLKQEEIKPAKEAKTGLEGWLVRDESLEESKKQTEKEGLLGRKSKTEKEGKALESQPEKEMENALEICVLKEDKENGKRTRVLVLDGAANLMEDIERARNDFEKAKFEGFSEEEMMQYMSMEERVKENIKKVLQ